MNIKSVTIHAGHNKQGKVACGASDYIDESKEARVITKAVKKKLILNGIKVKDCTENNGKSQSDVLNKIVKKCNVVSRDIDISIHFNANIHSTKDCKTKGVEVYVYGDNAKSNKLYTLSKLICTNISSIGFVNRGVKATKSLYFLRQTNRPALLIEVCFVDDEDDAILYKKNKSKIVNAIVDAILYYKK